jgi:FkbM family methyltransferase
LRKFPARGYPAARENRDRKTGGGESSLDAMWRKPRDLLPPAARMHAREISFAQEAEDLILADLFPADWRGFYVDVGAHHPYRFSNTAYFALRGWSGINIDAAPGTTASFAQARPHDITLECAVGETEGTMDFFLFDEPALNTLEPDRVKQLERDTAYRVKEVRRLPVRRLDSLLAEHMPAGRTIDFLSVDVEGHEMGVVRSNDWRRFRPRFVLLELLGRGVLDLGADPVVGEMLSASYTPFVKGPRTVFFRDAGA